MNKYALHPDFAQLVQQENFLNINTLHKYNYRGGYFPNFFATFFQKKSLPTNNCIFSLISMKKITALDCRCFDIQNKIYIFVRYIDLIRLRR